MNIKNAGKSPIHLQIQSSIKKLLAPEKIVIEKRFGEINRIADVVWPAKKLIFEVQVSPISAEEIGARNRDYALMGYQVIWILHDCHFNRFHLTPAEIALRALPHYFTNIDGSGKGFFYDQIALISKKKRIKRSPRFPINLSAIKQKPCQLTRERKQWPVSFEGDLLHQKFEWKPDTERFSRFLCSFFRPFKIILHLLLEKSCS